MKEWTEVIRDARFFNLLVSNTKDMDTDLSFHINTCRGEITVQYDSIFRVDSFDMPNPPNWVAVSEAQSHATPRSTKKNIVPHAEDPAPAQSAGSIAFIWGKNHSSNGTIDAHREDGFPAVIIATGLRKHYTYGKLNRKRQHPAIKAEHLAALWSEKPGEFNRGCGPCDISFENYKEFWVDGEFKGHRWSDHCLDWKPRGLATAANKDALTVFLGNLNGTTNMFSDMFFADEEDEVCYIADFA
jgi:hypothetical protein